ncbi:uncharacterized protein RB166_019239 [Leptodactylus fuscus]|uniref:uncharacterized protein LOC142219230 n=1 Tax=Leptodactylus fuscus TaxID=238119 RepID=UPI003F4F1E14
MAMPLVDRDNVPPCCKIPSIPCPPWQNFSEVPYERQSMDFHEMFLRGKPKWIGISQMALGFFQLGMGILATSVFPTNYSSYIGNNIWGPLCFIVTGGLSFYAGAHRSLQYIKLALAMNICNIFISAVGIALNSLRVESHQSFGNYRNYYPHENRNSANNNISSLVRSKPHKYSQKELSKEPSTVTVSFLILTNALQSLLTISILISGCQSLSCNDTGAPQVYVIPNDGPSLLPPPYSADPIFLETPPCYSECVN